MFAHEIKIDNFNSDMSCFSEYTKPNSVAIQNLALVFSIKKNSNNNTFLQKNKAYMTKITRKTITFLKSRVFLAEMCLNLYDN